ncbi:hypothetical protein RCL1_006291 [Eukaryota sp. TZLM3-RCL]
MYLSDVVLFSVFARCSFKISTALLLISKHFRSRVKRFCNSIEITDLSSVESYIYKFQSLPVIFSYFSSLQKVDLTNLTQVIRSYNLLNNLFVNFPNVSIVGAPIALDASPYLGIFPRYSNVVVSFDGMFQFDLDLKLYELNSFIEVRISDTDGIEFFIEWLNDQPLNVQDLKIQSDESLPCSDFSRILSAFFSRKNPASCAFSQELFNNHYDCCISPALRLLSFSPSLSLYHGDMNLSVIPPFVPKLKELFSDYQYSEFEGTIALSRNKTLLHLCLREDCLYNEVEFSSFCDVLRSLSCFVHYCSPIISSENSSNHLLPDIFDSLWLSFYFSSVVFLLPPSLLNFRLMRATGVKKTILKDLTVRCPLLKEVSFLFCIFSVQPMFTESFNVNERMKISFERCSCFHSKDDVCDACHISILGKN